MTSTPRASLLVHGHTLAADGRAFNRALNVYQSGPGWTRCSCGVESGHLPSNQARKDWHYAHKQEILGTGGAEAARGTTPLPSYRPPDATVTKRCPASLTICSEAQEPGFNHNSHVICPQCLRPIYIRPPLDTYPSHFIRISPGRDDEIAKTRIYPTKMRVTGQGRYDVGGGRRDHSHNVVHRLVYRDRSYLIWRVGEEYYWSISPDDVQGEAPIPFEEKIHLAVAETLNAAREIVVDWGVGGSIYDPRYRET